MRLDPLNIEHGKLTFAIEHEGCSGLIVLSLFEGDDGVCLGITQLTGKIAYPPRRWVAVVRSAMTELSVWAKTAGCHEIRLCGRDWSRILPDFQPLSGFRNGLRKAL